MTRRGELLVCYSCSMFHAVNVPGYDHLILKLQRAPSIALFLQNLASNRQA